MSRSFGRRRMWVLSALVLCTLGIAATAGAAAKPPASATYKGKTSKGLAVSFRVAGGTVHNFSAGAQALCISVVDGSSKLDLVHLVTPPPGKLDSRGKFSLLLKKGSIYMAAAGRVTGASAGGTYEIRYTGFNGTWVTACLDRGTWKATAG